MKDLPQGKLLGFSWKLQAEQHTFPASGAQPQSCLRCHRRRIDSLHSFIWVTTIDTRLMAKSHVLPSTCMGDRQHMDCLGTSMLQDRILPLLTMVQKSLGNQPADASAAARPSHPLMEVFYGTSERLAPSLIVDPTRPPFKYCQAMNLHSDI